MCPQSSVVGSKEDMKKLKLGSKKGQPPVGSKKGKICEIKWCRTPKARKANGYLLSICWKHKSRLLKQRHPATYFLNMLRHSARKRKLPFSLTLKQFRRFCAKTRFLERRGNSPFSLTVDRKDPMKGYSIRNIQVLTHAENSEKQDDPY